MTAPIVGRATREPLSAYAVEIAGPIEGSTKRRLPIPGDPVRGDLWEREAERDVRVHGEPAPPAFIPHEFAAALERGSITNPGPLLRQMLELRRHQMRRKAAS